MAMPRAIYELSSESRPTFEALLLRSVLCCREEIPVFLDRGATLKLATLILALLTAVTKPKEDPDDDFLCADLLWLPGVSKSSGSSNVPPVSQLTVFRL